MTDLQQSVQLVLDELVADGVERGLQVAVVHRGVPVVDAAAGVADPSTGRPVTPDTPFFSFSTGKAMAATLVHILVGELARRVTGEQMSVLLRDRIATPPGLGGELYFGVPEPERARPSGAGPGERDEPPTAFGWPGGGVATRTRIPVRARRSRSPKTGLRRASRARCASPTSSPPPWRSGRQPAAALRAASNGARSKMNRL